MPFRTRLVAVTRRRRLAHAIGALAILACGAAGGGVADACSCDANPPCRAFWSADVVFLGTVASVGVERADAWVDRPVTFLDVQERLRGDVSGRVRVIGPAESRSAGPALAPGAPRPVMISSCDYEFQVGQRYLVYARRRPDGALVTTECAGTKPADRALEDLAFIQSVPGLPPGGRIFGTATRVFANPLDSAKSRTAPATGLRLLFEREQRQFEVATGADGEYELIVPPGEYTVRPVVPATIRAYHPRVVRVADRGCAPCGVSITANGRIEGTLTTSDGRPLPKQSVLALPADAVTDEQRRASSLHVGQTNEAGHYSIDALPPGRYVVGVNVLFGPRVGSPYRAYWPATSEQAEASVVTIGDGERRGSVDIVAQRLPIVTVTGVVRDGEGTPVAGATVLTAWARSPFAYFGEGGDVRTDAEGRFTVRLPGSTRYSVRVQAGAHPQLRTAVGECEVGIEPAECLIVLPAVARPTP